MDVGCGGHGYVVFVYMMFRIGINIVVDWVLSIVIGTFVSTIPIEFIVNLLI